MPRSRAASHAPESDRSRIPVTIHCDDPLTRAGLLSHLRTDPLVEPFDAAARPGVGAVGGVAVVLAERVDDLGAARLRRIALNKRVVLVVERLREPELLRALETGVTAIVLRHEATPERLAAAVRSAARGDRDLPSDLLGQLVDVVNRMRREPATGTGAHPPTERELEVLRLLAEGWETRAIAEKLAYSERTVKNVLQGLNARFQLRNRTHAVAYALREGYL
ncbi:response regulator transcription factor [Cryptosporangium sp. NPDC048952]|uniref:response regulator transcription factor n=1 Tax=Cryptosporangium sp. NPDC048952 TaxID=3363961 RepID=UPI003723A516